jgi:ABC-2 type transport system ATP-binding protein
MSNAIEVEALSKTYRSKGRTIEAVTNLNLTVPSGQVIAFLGPNGAGKTTSIKMICGLITPSDGQICLNGYNLARQPRNAFRQISAVLEGTRNIYWRLSAWENLLYFGRLRGINGPVLKQRAEQLLRELNLWDRRSDEPRQFSRGMQQKLAIACALVTDPSIVLLDEPTLGLDVQAAKTVEEWVVKLSRERGKTVLITTHQLDMAQKISDRVAIMDKGKLVADEPVQKLLSLFTREIYQIKVGGLLDKSQLICPDDFTLTVENGETTISGAIHEQPLLYALIDRLRALNLPLLSISRTEPTLEDVFIDLCNWEPQR